MTLGPARLFLLATLLATAPWLAGCGGEGDTAISASDKYDLEGNADRGQESRERLQDMGTDSFGGSRSASADSSASNSAPSPPPASAPARPAAPSPAAPTASAPSNRPPASRPPAGAPSPPPGDERSGSVAGVPKPPTQPPGDDLLVPDGTPEELMAFVESLQRRQPQAATQQQMIVEIQKMFVASIQACEKILAQEAAPELHRRAAEVKLVALENLAQIGVPEAAGHIRRFCSELRKHPDEVLARLGLILDFGLRADDFVTGRETDFGVLEQDLQQILAGGQVSDRDLAAVEQAALRLMENNYAEQGKSIIQQTVARFRDSSDPAIAQRVAGMPEKVLIMNSDIPVRMEHFSQTGQGADKMVESVSALLAEEERGRNILGLAVQVADALERQSRFDATRQLYTTVVEAYRDHPDPDVVRFSVRAKEASDARINLLGQPLTLSGQLLSGDPIPWQSYQGQVTLVFFWSSNNLLSMQELGLIAQAHQKFASQGFAALGVNIDGDPAMLRQFLSVQRTPWENVCIDSDDQNDPIAKATGLGPVPYNILIDRSGVVAKIHVPGVELAREIERLLAASPAPPAADPPAADAGGDAADVPAAGGEGDPPGDGQTTEPAGDGDQGGQQESAAVEPAFPWVYVSLKASSQEPAGDEPQSGEEPQPPSNPYLAPASASVAELIDFLFAMEDKPKTIRRRPGFGAAVADAADRVLADANLSAGQLRVAWESKLQALHYAASWDDQQAAELLRQTVADLPEDLPEAVRSTADFLRLEQRALAGEELKTEEITALLAEIVAFFEKLGADSGEQHLRLASAAVGLANRLEAEEVREEQFQQLGKALAASDNGELSRYGRKLFRPAGASPNALVGKPLELSGVTFLGDDFQWSDYRGKVVLVDFWATWCGPCLREMPHVRELYDELHDKGFEIVAVSLDQDIQAVRDFLQEKKTPWTNLIGEETQALAERYGVRAIPTMMLVDEAGNVAAVSHKVSDLAPQARELLSK